MSRTVRIQGDTAVYPAGACVACLRPATCEIEIAKIKGYAVRKVRVPFCHECAALRQFKSFRQVVFERVATVCSVLLGLAVGTYVYLRISETAGGSAGVWALLLGALSALVVFGVCWVVVEPWSRRFRSDATVEALCAVRIKDFDWETTTLQFADEEYAEQFARANAG